MQIGTLAAEVNCSHDEIYASRRHATAAALNREANRLANRCRVRGDAPLSLIRVRAGGRAIRSRGWLSADGLTIPVALGRGGIRANKREGDGGTPRGRFRPLRLWWRADRAPRPRTALPVRPIGRRRRLVRGSRRAGTTTGRSGSQPGEAGDRLRRDDQLYDFIIEIDHNTRPRIAGRGSAVFLHLAREQFRPHRRLRGDDAHRRCCGCWRGSGRGRRS